MGRKSGWRALIAQSRLPHSLQKMLHQFGGLVWNAGLDPVDRKLRLLTFDRDKEFTGFIDSPNLGKARAVQTLRSVKARTQS